MADSSYTYGSGGGDEGGGDPYDDGVEARLPGGANGIARTLKSILASGSWSDLGGAVIGGLLYQLWAGVINLPLALGDAVGALVSPVTDGLSAGVGSIGSTLVSEAEAVWTPLDAGIFGLPLNAAILIVAMWVAVRGYRVIQDG
ncbi:hypothetical protein GCM10009037_07120 [Halarchaeum grantii]|uniref:Uncharacterized protein n=1 Tax=Halarchaeum grantii TaxID=1193105 RepID=A0A830F760_9EURY|nr:hypothetical protein [Halarchaeum grantii]GGL26071.1 hypothetical protein GCM10009037_07120 [Halarchaeum grantii]